MRNFTAYETPFVIRAVADLVLVRRKNVRLLLPTFASGRDRVPCSHRFRGGCRRVCPARLSPLPDEIPSLTAGRFSLLGGDRGRIAFVQRTDVLRIPAACSIRVDLLGEPDRTDHILSSLHPIISLGTH